MQEHTIATEKRLKYVSWAAAALVVFTAVLLASTFALTYTVVDMHKDSQSAVRAGSAVCPAKPALVKHPCISSGTTAASYLCMSWITEGLDN